MLEGKCVFMEGLHESGRKQAADGLLVSRQLQGSSLSFEERAERV